MKIELPPQVQHIINTLVSHGFEAYAVGGCVRDSLLGRNPQDWDITTSATPEQVKELFSRTIDTGIAHGTVTVMLDRTGYEVTTYRIDGEYEDARHPKEVTFTSNLLEDLKRRDFTINAMAYNETDGLVDAFDGIGDLKEGIIRCVGDPAERFTEDALRMLRAVRFAAQLGFTVEEHTRQAVTQLAGTIAKVSAERIQMELNKLLVSAHPEEIRQVYVLGLTKVFLPEFDVMMETDQNSKHHLYTVGEHTIRVLQNCRADRVLRLAALFHDVAKPACKTTGPDGRNHFKGHPAVGADMTSDILRRLKYDNATIDRVAVLVRYHDDRPELNERNVRRAMNRIGVEHIPMLLELKRADVLAQSLYEREEKLAYVDTFEALYKQILKNEDCVTKKDLAIGGKELIAMGMKPGPKIGETIDALLDAVLEEPALNTREKLTELAHKWMTPDIG
jgi:tRNA nucleotidyltransferase (CCA-adding enzyme)